MKNLKTKHKEAHINRVNSYKKWLKKEKSIIYRLKKIFGCLVGKY